VIYVSEVILANGQVITVEDAYQKDGVLRLYGPAGYVMLSQSAWIATRKVQVDDDWQAA
jgi:hypothetical protein